MNLESRTIAAVSTPRGKGGIAVIRISGKDAFRIADAVFKPIRGTVSEKPLRTAVYGDILSSDGEVCDRGICTLFASPASFTGEDMAEISCHGGTAVTEEVYMSAIFNGASPAEAGEFTKRAFVNGKLSLTEAEAVGRLIDADTSAKVKLSGGGLRGNVSREIKRISDGMLDVMTALYAAIDYPEEDVGDEGEQKIVSVLCETLDGVRRLLDTYKVGRAVSDGVKTVICGKPNVGKSSLFNLMTGEESAIVTSHAGTTRDILRETVSFGGVTLRLSDTAGIRDAADEVEKIGVDRAEGEIENAELVIAVFDGSEPLSADDGDIIEKLGTVSAVKIAVVNKSDIGMVLDDGDIAKIIGCADRLIYISAEQVESAADILSAEIASLWGSDKIDLGRDAVIWDARQRAMLSHASASLSAAVNAAENGAEIDAICTFAEEALAALNETDGRGIEEEIVSEIFSRFCVGK